ncbi:MAG: PAS domain-containing protein, partial [Erysipelotrichaceae bacterium]|nr:PAS domain-containing protein [Erysipelotrichaceae bacterium]
MDIKRDLAFLKRLVKGISAEFGPNCEVVLHDLTEDVEHTIVAIENGHISGRRVGDSASEIVLETIGAHGNSLDDKYNYHIRTKDGRILKATSICVRDDEGKVTGILGINYDLTVLMVAKKFMDTLAISNHDNESRILNTIPVDVSELLNILIEES